MTFFGTNTDTNIQIGGTLFCVESLPERMTLPELEVCIGTGSPNKKKSHIRGSFLISYRLKCSDTMIKGQRKSTFINVKENNAFTAMHLAFIRSSLVIA